MEIKTNFKYIILVLLVLTILPLINSSNLSQFGGNSKNNFIISGNNILHSGYALTPGYLDGLECLSCSNSVISNNVFNDVVKSGLRVDSNSFNMSIYGNTIMNYNYSVSQITLDSTTNNYADQYQYSGAITSLNCGNSTVFNQRMVFNSSSIGICNGGNWIIK
jgi:hypothetical protein